MEVCIFAYCGDMHIIKQYLIRKEGMTMKNCPNCNELLGDSVTECFNCHYSYIYKRVITKDEQMVKKKQQMKELEKREEENRLKQAQLSKNPLFEYKVIVINDLSSGQVDNIKIQETLNEWSEKGWRLHSIYSSEIGKNSTGISIAGFGSITNATIDQTVLIFERCIKA